MADVAVERVLVTGSGGFLARHLLPKVPGALALFRSPARWDAARHFEGAEQIVPVFGDLEEPSRWSAGLGDVKAIVHMAALVRHSRWNSAEVYRTNVEGTLAMVRLASQLGARLVFVSTSGTVGCFSSCDEAADEGAPYCRETIRRWPYYDSKMQAEIQARALACELGVDLVIVRLPVLLGPGDHVGRSTRLVEKLISGRQRFVMKGGIAFTDVRDVATGLMTIMTTPHPRAVYHLPGTSCSLSQFFLRCAELSGADLPRMFLPGTVARLAARVAGEAAKLVGSRSFLPDPVVVEMASHYWGFRSRWADEIGFVPRSADETLRDTIAWLRSSDVGDAHAS
jgi:nucleoside-diphosphate-sugar epimerase